MSHFPMAALKVGSVKVVNIIKNLKKKDTVYGLGVEWNMQYN